MIDVDDGGRGTRIVASPSPPMELVRKAAAQIEQTALRIAKIVKGLRTFARDGERALVTLALEAAQKLVSGLPISAELIEAAVKEACAAIDLAQP